MLHRFPAPHFAALLLSLGLTPLSAQTPAERAPLLALVDTITIWDSTIPRDRFDATVQRLENVLDRHGDWEAAWYALGRIEQAMDQRGFVVKPTPYHHAGLSYRRGAMDRYVRSIRGDATFLPSADALAALIIAQGNRKLDQDYRESLVQAASVPDAGPDIHLAVARLWYSDGKPEQALAAIADYERHNGRVGVTAIERSRILQALGRDHEAREAYRAGLGSPLTAGDALAYREDLAWVASPDELAAFDSLPVAQVARWVGAFWQERDALEMREPGERLSEHLRRWVYAHQKFRILRPFDAPLHSEGQRDNDLYNVVEGTDPFLSIVLSGVALNAPGWKLYRRTQWEVDDRGVIYIRHGEPTRKVSSPSEVPNESWLYQRATDRPIFHFLSSHALGTTAATTLVASLPMTPEMLDARGSLDPRYGAMGDYVQGRVSMLRAWWNAPFEGGNKNPAFQEALADLRSGGSARSAKLLVALARAGDAVGPGSNFPSFSPGLQEKAQAETERGRRTVTDGVTSDGFPQVFGRELNAVIQLHGIGVEQKAQHRVLAVFALDGSSVPPKARPDGKAGFYYPVAIRLIALDRAGGVVRQLDTIRNFVTADSLRAGQHLTGFLELPVPPGTYQVRALLTSPGIDAGAGAARDNVDLTESPGDLRLSDLILGREGSNLGWRFAGQSFPLNPLNAFPRGADAELFYELDGMTPGKNYHVTMAVRRPGEGSEKKPLVESTFSFTATEPYQVVRRSLGLEQLKPGGYNLTVVIDEDGSERSVTRARALNVLEK